MLINENVYIFSDAQLIDRWQNGDKAAFALLYKRYLKALVKKAYLSVRNTEVAIEIAQDTFLALYDKKGNLPCGPMPYLMGILSHKIADYYRRKLEVETVPLNGEEPGGGPSDNNADGLILEKELEMQYQQGLDRLPGQCRKVFVLRKEQQLSNSEVAKHLGISVKTVETQMTKALRILRAYFDYYAVLGVILWAIHDFLYEVGLFAGSLH